MSNIIKYDGQDYIEVLGDQTIANGWIASAVHRSEIVRVFESVGKSTKDSRWADTWQFFQPFIPSSSLPFTIGALVLSTFLARKKRKK